MHTSFVGRCAVAGCLAACAAGHAAQIDLANPDLRLSWDNAVSFSLGVRTASRQDALAANPDNDEGDYKFGRGQVTTTRLELRSEFDLALKKTYGLRLSAAAWADPAYGDKVERNPALAAAGYASGYANDRYSADTKRYYAGPSGEWRDAFVYGSFDLGGVQTSVRLGRHTVYWGEALFTQGHGIAYSQGPLDARKAAADPGAQVKDLFLPSNRLSLQAQLSERVSLGAQYDLQWQPSRLSEGGTYYGFFDAGFTGPTQLALAAALAPTDAATAAAVSPLVGGIPAALLQANSQLSLALPPLQRQATLRPRNAGNWGLNLRFEPTGFDGTVGVYYRRLDEKFPWKPQIIAGATAVPITLLTNATLQGFGLPAAIPLGPQSVAVPNAYRFVYATGVDLFGLSASTRLGDASVAGELSYRRNTALQGFVQPVSPLAAGDNQGPRGDVLNLVGNAVFGLTSGPLWDTGLLLVEGVYSRVQKVTLHEELYEAEGHAACAGRDRRDGCATRDTFGLGLGFTPQWLSVWPSVNLSLPVSLTLGLKGNSATAAGFYERGVIWSVGVEADIRQFATVRLSYNDQHYSTRPAVNGVVTSGNGYWQLNDRGALLLTARVAF